KNRHSPAVKVIELLRKEGAHNISYCDPYVPVLCDGDIKIEGKELTPELVAAADLVVITTGHKEFDYEMVVTHAKKIIDTRNATQKIKHSREKISVLGDGMHPMA
ncbi:MAG: UDP-N-acetyl-D-glucosamine dehydrogenase, partial [Desulfobulbaceae bacterium]|nr:UDP-N-acetyl-D-glucosamine dehydrogenase [Desulfobulbaceae bacterium]